MLDCPIWTPRHLHGRRTRLAPDRCSSARRLDHRDQQVGQARSLATPLLSDGDIIGFKSPGQSNHKPPLLAAPSASWVYFFGWPVYSVFDEVTPFDVEIEAGYFYIDTDNFFSFKGARWYDADLVFYACECKLIKTKNIFLQYKSSTVLAIDSFKNFIEEVYNLFDHPEYAINTLSGIFGHNYKSKNIHNFTQDSRLLLNELSQNDDAKVKYIFKSKFMTDYNNDNLLTLINLIQMIT
jgi:hypothetical protein